MGTMNCISRNVVLILTLDELWNQMGTNIWLAQVVCFVDSVFCRFADLAPWPRKSDEGRTAAGEIYTM